MHKTFSVFCLRTLSFSALLLWANCRSLNPTQVFDPAQIPPAPNYAQAEHWAALPTREDLADETPQPQIQDLQASAQADVFFLHPTTLLGDRKSGANRRAWNGDVNDAELNHKTDFSPIKYQASIFNSAGRVFAPRYRQAHLNTFFTQKDKVSAGKALDLAYSDICAAFEYYLKNYNQGRPIIIAAHSQGARHALFLLRDYFEGKPLQNQLVVAYVVGWPAPQSFFKKLPACETPEQTGCFCSWRTYERNFVLKFTAKKPYEPDVVVTNPLTWTTRKDEYAPKTLNKGAVLTKFNQIYPELCDAEVHQGVLMCTRPKFPGSFLIRTHNYHAGDLNLYYFNVRENAEARVQAFLKKK